MTHANAPLSVEGRRRLVKRCRTRPIAHVAAEMGISRATASKWANRYRHHDELGLHDRSSTPHCQPTATAPDMVARIEKMRRTDKRSAARIAHELAADQTQVSRRTISRRLADLGLNRRKFIDPSGDTNREPQKIVARRPGHMVHVDVKKVGRVPDGGGWRVHGPEAPRRKTPSARRGRPSAAATSTSTPRSTATPASPTPKPSRTRKPLPRSRSCTEYEPGSPPTASPTTSG